MTKLYNGIEEMVGHTPIMLMKRYCAAVGIDAGLMGKFECFNPAGSAKDRVALSLILDAEKRGVLKEGSVIIEPTSGNTGIGLAAIGRARGYRVILTMPDTMSSERRALLIAYGAELVLTCGRLGMSGAIEKASELAVQIPNSYIPGQFENSANPKAHYESTGVEIWNDTDGDIDCFVAGVGTGGTLSGVGRYLREKKPSIDVVAVEPFESPVLSKGTAFKGVHGLQGIGADFVPKTLDTSIYNEIASVKTEEAYETARLFAKYEGMLIGISGAAALFAAANYARRTDNRSKKILVLFPDSGEHYLSTNMFCD